MSSAARTSGLVVRYYFAGPLTRLIHTAKFFSENDLRTQPKLMEEWIKRTKEYAMLQGPDAARAAIAIMSTPHTGGTDSSEPEHTTTVFEDEDGDLLVCEQDDGRVYTRMHVYKDEKLWKKCKYRKETPKEKEKRLAREEEIAAKKAAIKASKDEKMKRFFQCSFAIVMLSDRALIVTEKIVKEKLEG